MDTSTHNTNHTTTRTLYFDLNEPASMEPEMESSFNVNHNANSIDRAAETVVVDKSPQMLVTPSDDGMWVIDFNIHSNSVSEYPLMELDLNQLPLADDDQEDDLRDDAAEIFSNGHPLQTALDGEERLGGDQPENRRYKVVDDRLRQEIYEALLTRSVNGKLKKNTTKEISSLFGLNIRTIQRIWRRAKNTPEGESVNVCSRRRGNYGRKRIQIDPTIIRDIPYQQRTPLMSLATSAGISYTTMFRLMKRGLFRRHSNAIKPHLREGNKISRLQFCLSMLDESSSAEDPKFQSMFNYVHIDEKWFYLTKKEETYYLLPDEEEPLRTCQSKNYIGKAMFLAAVARPRFDDNGNEVFSGKVGIFPFVTEQPAQRRSRNREAGTLEMKAMTSVKRETVKHFLIEKVIPAIKHKWPRSDIQETIFIQQDNARTHVDPSDPDFCAAATRDDFDIRLVCQPPNSPDLNVLDLGFFRGIQSLQQKKHATTIEELVHEVQNAFEVHPMHMLNRVFLTLQCCMKETMKSNGGNRYTIPHIKKGQLEREGRLPTQISCESILVQNVRNLLEAQGV